MNNQLVMKESKVNPMHDSPFHSSFSFPISTIAEAIILSTTNTVFVPITFISHAQSIHADYLSHPPGDPPWVIISAWLCIKNIGLTSYETLNIVIKGPRFHEMKVEKFMKHLEPWMRMIYRYIVSIWNTLPFRSYTSPAVHSSFDRRNRWTWCTAP